MRLTHQFEKGFGVDIFDQHIVQPAGIPPLLIGPDHGIAGVAEGVMPLRRRFVNLLVERLSTLGVRLLAQFLHPEILRFAIRRLQRHAPRGGLGQSRAQGLGRRIGQHVADLNPAVAGEFFGETCRIQCAVDFENVDRFAHGVMTRAGAAPIASTGWHERPHDRKPDRQLDAYVSLP